MERAKELVVLRPENPDQLVELRSLLWQLSRDVSKTLAETAAARAEYDEKLMKRACLQQRLAAINAERAACKSIEAPEKVLELVDEDEFLATNEVEGYDKMPPFERVLLRIADEERRRAELFCKRIKIEQQLRDNDELEKLREGIKLNNRGEKFLRKMLDFGEQLGQLLGDDSGEEDELDAAEDEESVLNDNADLLDMSEEDDADSHNTSDNFVEKPETHRPHEEQNFNDKQSGEDATMRDDHE